MGHKQARARTENAFGVKVKLHSMIKD